MTKQILLAEDETISRKWLSDWLRRTGYDVSEAKDGAEPSTSWILIDPTWCFPTSGCPV